MKFERFIAQRFMPRSKDGGGFSGPLSVIAVASIALGVVVMIMAVSVLRGFQNEITRKVSGFGSHLTVTNYAINPSYQETPVTFDSALMARMQQVSGVRHVQCYATKGGMVKTEEQIYGIMFRGMSSNYDTSFFSESLVEGRLPGISQSSSTPSNEVLISSTIARRLHLAVGDKMRTYFWQNENYRARAFTISGIYNTDLTEMDELYVIGDLRQVQRLNDWVDSSGASRIGGYELLVDDFDQLDAIASQLLEILPYYLSLQTIKGANPALFAWLDLLNSNISLILIIMCIVCMIAIVSALLIMIFEKGSTIGLLKALGASNASVRKVFLLKASRLIAQGIVIGDIVAFALCFAQKHWKLLKLDAESYHMELVPVDTDPLIFLFISAGTLVACLLALLLPAAYVSHISPAKTMRIEK